MHEEGYWYMMDTKAARNYAGSINDKIVENLKDGPPYPVALALLPDGRTKDLCPGEFTAERAIDGIELAWENAAEGIVLQGVGVLCDGWFKSFEVGDMPAPSSAFDTMDAGPTSVMEPNKDYGLVWFLMTRDICIGTLVPFRSDEHGNITSKTPITKEHLRASDWPFSPRREAPPGVVWAEMSSRPMFTVPETETEDIN